MPVDPMLTLRSARASDSRVAEEVRVHPARAVLGALAFDVLSRQAEGRVLFAGHEYVQRRAAEHAVQRDDAGTSAGNLLTMLERGPEQDAERTMVAAFALRGFGARLSESRGAEADALLTRLIRHADWLELATPYRVLPLVDATLPESVAKRVWEELAQLVVDEAGGAEGAGAPVRARNAARLSALAGSESTAARAALSRIVASAIDGPTRALASALAGGGEPRATAKVRGRVVARPATGVRALARWWTGWALLTWLLRGAGSLLGVRREAELTLGDSGLEVREEHFAFGRKVGERLTTVAPSSLAEVGRRARYPVVHLLVGVVALAAGLLAGGLLVFDGARSGELSLVLAGAALALLGAGLDLGLDVLGPGKRARVTLGLSGQRGLELHLGDVPLAEADAFLAALRARA